MSLLTGLDASCPQGPFPSLDSREPTQTGEGRGRPIQNTMNEPVLCVRPMVSMLHQGCTVTTTASQMGKLRLRGLLQDPIANKFGL